MKILLVSPCADNNQRHDSMAIPQLTLSLLAGMTPDEHEVDIVEEVYSESIDFDADVDLVGISIMTQTAIRGYEIANEFKKRGKTVVFGGIHATVLPKEAIRFGDAVAIGEVENGLWVKILQDIESNNLQEFYKLDEYPSLENYVVPRRDLINTSIGRFSIAPMETGRGCPYNCDFCTVPTSFGNKSRNKSIDKIIEDISTIKEKAIFFLDDNVSIDKKFAKELFKRLIPFKKLWVGQASINIANDEELMTLAHQSGCRGLLIGFESMTESGICKYKKTLSSFEQNADAIKRLQKHGIMVMASFVFGLDDDTKQVFDNTFKFIKLAKPAFLQACALTPYPGTQVFDRMKAEGRILTDDWRQFDAKKVIVSPKGMTAEDMQEGYTWIKDQTYSVKSIVSRGLPNVFKGFTPAAMYSSLNIGARKWHKSGLTASIYRNPENSPVDFDVTKYVMPFKEALVS